MRPQERPTAAAAAMVMLSALSLTGSGVTAQAPDDPAVDFLLTPSRLELRAEPGERRQVAVTVYNRADEPLLLDAYIEDIDFPTSELIEPDDLAFTASRWLSFGTDQLEIAGGANADITINADVPAETPTGGYHALGFLQSRPPAGSTEIQPSGRIGVTLLLEVSPPDAVLDRSAQVSESGLRVRWNNPFDADVIARTVVDNTGEAHVVAGGVHTFRGWPGAGNREAKVGPHTTLRGTRHTFESTWDVVPLFGKVTVTSEIVYQVGPDDLPVIVSQHTIWIIPWHLFGTLGAGLVLTYLLLRRRKATTHQRRQIAESPS